MGYKILVDSEVGTLVQEVNRLIKRGWRPLGGISIAAYVIEGQYNCDESFIVYAQAMVKDAGAAT